MNFNCNFRNTAKRLLGISVILFVGIISFPAVAVTYSQSYSSGWNLAGNSLTTAINVKATFASQTTVQSIWKWDAAGANWAFYSPALDTAGTLASYRATKGYGDLTSINPGEGYWVNASAPVSLGTQSGTGFPLLSSNLATGWNLVATGDDISPATFTTTIGNVTTQWAWDNANSNWYFYAPALSANNTLASYISSKNYEDFGILTVGKGLGFWVNYAGSTSYTIGGTVSGLVGSLVLQDNYGDNLTVTANGTFTFATKVASGNPYSVTVLNQPAGQTCTASISAGTVSGANITSVSLACAIKSYTVGGSVSGLIGSVVLQDNNGDNLTVGVNGTFTFVNQLANDSPYSVTVLTNPSNQSCSVVSGTGIIALANVSNVAVTCTTINGYTIGGTIYTPIGHVVLQDNNGDNLTLNAAGAFHFTFSTMVGNGSAFNVTVLTQPDGATCVVTGGSGIAISNVLSVHVNCTLNPNVFITEAGLTWMTVSSTLYTFGSAVNECGRSINGLTWRLPTQSELNTLFSSTIFNSPIVKYGWTLGNVWSSTLGSYATVDLTTNMVNVANGTAYVTCVH
jgi:hypothetical protein